MAKIRLILFNFLEKNLSFFSKLGINRKTPGVLRVYNFLFKKFWPFNEIIETQGSRMYVNIDGEDISMRNTFKGYASNLIHEKNTTDLFKKVIKEGNVVVDLGANIGYFTLLAAKLVGPEGRVFAFEPEPKNYSYLIKNIELNNYNNIQFFQKAVADKNGKTRLYICDYDTGHHTINQYNGIEAYSRGRLTKEHSIEVETITLNDFFKNREETIDVIKMDVEGAEALALAGMDKILGKNKKLKMFIEFFPLLIEKMGSSPDEFIRKLLENYGFSIYMILGDYDAKKGGIVKANSIDEIMSFHQKKEDHINLFLTRGNANEMGFEKN